MKAIGAIGVALAALVFAALPANALVTVTNGGPGPGANKWLAGYSSTPLLSGTHTIAPSGAIMTTNTRGWLWDFVPTGNPVTQVSFYGKLTSMTLFVGGADGFVHASPQSGQWQWYNITASGLGLDGNPEQLLNFALVGTGRASQSETSAIYWNGPHGAVPEPASWAMMIAGFGLVGAMARRRSTFVLA